MPVSGRRPTRTGSFAGPREISLVVNGVSIRRVVEPARHLADLLREDFGLRATHLGCEHGSCGTCSVLVDGQAVRACLVLAVQVDGHEVETLEGLHASGEIAALQDAFERLDALQCGFCTSGMLVSAASLLRRERAVDHDRVRRALSGNLCRCTGYVGIVEAVVEVAASRAAPGRPGAR